MTNLEPPAGLKAEAIARWTAVAPGLRDNVDREALATYCQVWVRWQQAEDGIAKTGQLVKNEKGRPVANPLIAIAKDAGAQVRTLEEKLGIGVEQDQDEPEAAEGPARSWLINRREIADLFGVHPITICKWERDDMPIAVRGSRGRPSKYDAKICLQWYVTRERAAITGDGRGFSPQQERALLDRKRVEELELRLQVKRGKLVPVEDVERDFAECANAVKARLRRVPTSVADRVVSLASQGPHAVTALLTSEIDNALRELSTGADVETGAA